MLSNKTKGYALGTIAAATYGMNPLFALPLYGNGMTPTSVLLFRYMFAILILGTMIKMRGRSFKVSTKNCWQLVGLGFLVAVSSLALFMSYNFMAAGIASTMLFIYPVLVAVIMALFFKERLTATIVVCLALALSGIALLYKGSDGATIDTTGTILVMVSALSYALYLVAINQTTLKNVATLTVTFYVILFGSIVFVVGLAFDGGLTLPNGWFSWGCAFALALFPTAISFLCTTRAIQYIGSTPTAILGALEPLTAVFFGIVIFNETMTLRDCIGMLLIIIAVTLVVAGGSITAPLTRFRKLFPKLKH